jgi:hypothetical protein
MAKRTPLGLRDGGFIGFLRRLFQADAEVRGEFDGSAAAPAPPLHVEHGPADPRQKPSRRK